MLTEQQYLDACGACQKWCADPRIKEGKCTTCERTPEQIAAVHGFVELPHDLGKRSDDEKSRLAWEWGHGRGYGS